jgi:hypothetical protein
MDNWEYTDIKSGRPAKLIWDLREDGSKTDSCKILIKSENGSIIEIKESAATVWNRIRKNTSKLIMD